MLVPVHGRVTPFPVHHTRKFSGTIRLTLGDGNLDFKEVALPVLREYGIPATVFVESKVIGV